MTFESWLTHFQRNAARHQVLEARIEWDAPVTLTATARRAFVRSFQRFELGESGDGERLLAKAALFGDPTYLAALELLVDEEQKHSVLFRRGLDRLQAPALESHWSDFAFTALRRVLGLRTELALFLIAETVAMSYFIALAKHAPDAVLRAVGHRIATDERDHIRFQIDRLRIGFRRTPGLVRAAVGLVWFLVAVGATTVLVADHHAALRFCGLSPFAYWSRAIRQFRLAAQSVLVRPWEEPLGPTTEGS